MTGSTRCSIGIMPARIALLLATAADALKRFVEQEMTAKELPAVSSALVDDRGILWSRGFRLARPAKRVSATAETVYQGERCYPILNVLFDRITARSSSARGAFGAPAGPDVALGGTR